MGQSMYTQFSGIEFPAGNRRAWDMEGAAESLRQFLSGEQEPSAQLKPTPAALPVFANETGDEFVIVPTEEGPSLLPWISGSAVDLDRGDLAAGGFLPKETLKRKSEDVPRQTAGRPSPEALFDIILQHLLKSGLIKSLPQFPKGHDADSGGPHQPPPDESSASNAPPGGEGSNQAPPSEEKEPSLMDTLADTLPQIGIEQTVGILAKALAEGIFDPWGIVAGGLGSLGTTAAMFALTNLMGGAPTDESSTAEWATSIVGPKLGPEAWAMIKPKYFGGGPDKPLALRQGDLDDMDNAIALGLPSVLIEGMCAARESDVVEPPGLFLTYGAMHTLIGGKCAARKDDTVSLVAPFTIPRCPGAVKTQIGGPSTSPVVPEEMRKWALDRFGTDKLPELPEGHDPNGGPLQSPAYVRNPATGEWNIWDGTQFGTNLSEFENLPNILPDSGPFRDFFTDKNGNWYLFGMDLGSPLWPGAGTGSTWWIPDKPFGIDMTPYWSFHDWRFHPNWDDQLQGFLGGILNNFLDVEIPSFLAGMEGRWWNPAALLMQIIYSLATTIAGGLSWADRQHQELHKRKH